ncbi:MAG: DUF6485 family protein [Elusimicrobia bacterium]|jgi:hypothetical protein|nr:DUF6485 family protein [Elusimicrobiota bacterium]
MTECNLEKNMEFCNCTYEPCSRKGKCCECIVYHKNLNEMPACFFPDSIEKTYDRSVETFIKIYRENGGF